MSEPKKVGWVAGWGLAGADAFGVFTFPTTLFSRAKIMLDAFDCVPQ